MSNGGDIEVGGGGELVSPPPAPERDEPTTNHEETVPPPQTLGAASPVSPSSQTRGDLLELARSLERVPEHDAVGLVVPKWVERTPLLKYRRVRNGLRLAAVVALVVNAVVFSTGPTGLPWLGFWTSLPLMFALFLSPFGIIADAPGVCRLIDKFERVYFSLMVFLLVMSLVLSVLMVALSSSEMEVANRLFVVASLVYLSRLVNNLNLGGTHRSRFLRAAYARHSWRLFMILIVLAILFLLVVVARAQLREIPLEGRPVVAPITSVSVIVTFSVIVLGLAARIASRQRKFFTILAQALADVEVAIRYGKSDAEVHAAALRLDACFGTGVDTGVPLLATPYETTHMRSVVLAAIERTCSKVRFDDGSLLCAARDEFREWPDGQVRDGLLSYIALRRRQLKDVVDVVA